MAGLNNQLNQLIVLFTLLFAMGLAAAAAPTGAQSLWGQPGSFAGIPASSLGINEVTLRKLYGPEALARAKTWVTDKKMLWCGTADNPDSEPREGIFPFESAAANTTTWPGACPSSAAAQALFDKGLAWRMLFNDNEAVCAFQAAGRLAKECAMAHLGAALSLGPNVNYAFIISPYIYALVLESLAAARTALEASTAAQLPLAPVLFKALSQRYCVDGPGQLNEALKMTPEAAFAAYNNKFSDCGAAFTASVTRLADLYPEDPNIAAIAAGALMERPAWKWWSIGSQTAGALAAVAIGVNLSTSSQSQGQSQSLTSNQAEAQTVTQQPISMTGELIKPHAALANTALSRGLHTNPNHLGLLHYMIHNLEQGPNPDWAQAVADRLFNLGGASQGHAAHMRTHIDMRVGDYGRVITGNKRAIMDDATWNLARSGGGIMSILYKYNPHNIAFVAEAAQHAGRFKDMAAAIGMLSYGAGFPLLADPSMGSLQSFHTRQVLQPLRFGMYQALLDGTNPGGSCPIQGVGESTTLTITLPGGQSHSVPCGQTCSDARLFARTVSLARLGKVAEANAELSVMVQQACKDKVVAAARLPACNRSISPPVSGTSGRKLRGINLAAVGSNTSDSAAHVDAAVDTVIADVQAVALAFVGNSAASQSQTLGLTSTKASGTLTINNGDVLSALNLLVPGAEVAGAAGQIAVQLRLLKQAVQLQNQLQYDEPAPFFYPIGETLAGVLLRQGSAQDIAEAAKVLRAVLFQWPRSALAGLALAETMKNGQDAAQSAATVELVLQSVTRLNDTVLDLAWL